MDTPFNLSAALDATGLLLARRGEQAAIVVVGGTALNLLGIVSRVTRDVDVIAMATPGESGTPRDVRAPDPLPAALADVVATVARDLGLPADWLNTVVGSQWATGLPPSFAARVTWEQRGGLWLGLAGRLDLIYLKLYAAADHAPTVSRHLTDLAALRPTDQELDGAFAWVATQDPTAIVAAATQHVIDHVRATRS